MEKITIKVNQVISTLEIGRHPENVWVADCYPSALNDSIARALGPIKEGTPVIIRLHESNKDILDAVAIHGMCSGSCRPEVGGGYYQILTYRGELYLTTDRDLPDPDMEQGEES